MKRLLFAGPVMFATACAAVGPDYRAPVLATPPGYAEAASRGDAADLRAWWTRFGDATLTRLVERALRRNLDLEQARARLAEARADEAAA
nr:TolC family protein [Caulobacteraceae bacterium]